MQEPPTPTLLRRPVREADLAVTTDGGPPPPPHRRPKLKKLRLAFILFGLAVIAVVSTVFGMLMAVASDLPALENQAEYKNARNSVLKPDTGACRRDLDACPEIARLTGNRNRILLSPGQISLSLQHAVIAIEDRRFFSHEGVDYKGIGRALWQDLLRKKAAQGGSTITQQFVKNALSAQGNRSVLQKLRESALAYHLERKWSKHKILTQYLNTVYFGNGAYGVESAMRTYFGDGDDGPDASQTGLGTPDDEQKDRGLLAPYATPAQAALLAGMIASPTLYDPVQNPGRARRQRDSVLARMLDQGFITRAEYEDAVRTEPPGKDEIDPPTADSDQPYFSSWLTQQLVDRYRPGVVFGGGLRIRTTIDPELQPAAEQAISRRIGGIGPASSLVAIENRTGEIKAMVGGVSFERKPFNLATNGHRQPGSAFKPFTLIAALGAGGVGPETTFASQPKEFPVPGSRTERFVVHNYEDQYAGISSLRSATAQSDNSVYAELGLKVGTRRIARLARRMGIRTPLSTNPAMTLGGLQQGLTPLEMAYAYSTIANNGVKVSGSLAPGGEGPVAIEQVKGSGINDKNEKRSERVFPKSVGETTQQLLAGVIQGGTGQAAHIGEFAAGKTGTTENYGDAWFVGFNQELTVAVWVGYPDRLKPMETEYRGGPVAGGTFPAEIWQDFMEAWIGIREAREAASGKQDDEEEGPPFGPGAPLQAVPDGEQATSEPEAATEPREEARPHRRERRPPERQEPAPSEPAPAPQPPQDGGGAGGGAPAPSD
jgi:penicillin-binding protein 1A